MATEKSEQKTILLLSPQKLLKNNMVLEALHIVKTPKTIDYIINELSAGELRKFFGYLPKQAKDVLQWFTLTNIKELDDRIKARHKAMRAGMAFEPFYKNAMLREMHGLFEQLKPFANLMKWYQKTELHGKLKTSPCVFSTYKPQLEFEVIKVLGKLKLVTYIRLNGSSFDLASFNRFYFLLESGSEYFLLGFKEFQTLEWLVQSQPEQYADNPLAYATNILAKLEEDYKVNRNGHFIQEMIESTPVHRVLLSELSGAFLMLTPQWLYENILIEGPFQETFIAKNAGEEIVIKRSKEEEEGFIQKLMAMHPNFARQQGKGYFYVSFSDANKGHWFLKTYHKLLNEDIEVVGMDMLQHFRYSPHQATTVMSVKEEVGNIITLNMAVTFGKEEVPLIDLQKTILAGQKTVLLKDGSIGVFDDEWVGKYGTVIKHGKVFRKEIRIAKWMALIEDSVNRAGGESKPAITSGWWDKWRKWQEPESVVYDVPNIVKATLRPYQQKGFEWMSLLAEAKAGACLADDMGLGKTLQTICFISNHIHKNAKSKSLIVCPASLIYNWLSEWQKFAPTVAVEVYHGANRNSECFANGTQVIITSYGAVRVDVEKVRDIPFEVVVIDESHNIKNPSAQITKAVYELQGASRIALSGTPVMNNTFDLYSQLNFVLPGMFGSREFFKREYADPIDLKKDVEKTKTLQRITAPFILRRTKEQVAPDLPPKTEMVLWCEMETDQRLAYESIRDNIKNNVFLEIKESGLQKGKLSILNGLLKLRQVCDHSELVKDEEVFVYESIKTKMLIAELQNIVPAHKALVFSQFTSMLDLLEPELKKAGIPFLRLDGSVASKNRQDLVDEFQQQEGGASVFLISLKAGNAGLNLVAADYVFLFDPWWNRAVENQAIDRVHRIGQTKPVYAYRLVCKGTLEEKIMDLQARKKMVGDSLISEEDGFVKNLDMKDIEFLFS
jgi:superfamily II DNA or RNA helicase